MTYIQPLWPKGKPFLRFTGAAANQRHEGAPASSAATPSWPAPACASQPLYHSSGIGRLCANSAPGSSQRSARAHWPRAALDVFKTVVPKWRPAQPCIKACQRTTHVPCVSRPCHKVSTVCDKVRLRWDPYLGQTPVGGSCKHVRDGLRRINNLRVGATGGGHCDQAHGQPVGPQRPLGQLAKGEARVCQGAHWGPVPTCCTPREHAARVPGLMPVPKALSCTGAVCTRRDAPRIICIAC